MSGHVHEEWKRATATATKKIAALIIYVGARRNKTGKIKFVMAPQSPALENPLQREEGK